MTKFRPAVSVLNSRLGGLETLKLCDVAHPKTPQGVLEKASQALETYIADELGGQLLDGVLLKEHQPPIAREAVAQILNQRVEREVSASQILVLPGSSTQWLDLVIGEAISTCVHNDHNIHGGCPRMPVVLAPAGSFKCGGFFPYANGGKLVYIPTKFENNYKLTAEILEETIQKIESSGTEVVSCLLLETPTALGQNFSPKEIATIGAVIARYPHILWVQDGYNLGTEHDGNLNPSLADLPEIALQGCTVSSFRRDWGGAASYANISVFHSFNKALVDKLAQSCSQTYFYGHLPFTGFQKVVTDVIAHEMVGSNFAKENQPYLKEQLAKYVNFVKEENQRINNFFNTKNVEYLKTIPAQAGQFGFLFFNQEMTNKAGIDSGTKLAELMCIYENCRVMPTLLDPMGIGKEPVGIRMNVAISEDPQENNRIVCEALERISKIVHLMLLGLISYERFSPVIQELKKGKEANIDWAINKISSLKTAKFSN